MTHEYIITVELKGGYYCESDTCPSEWRGSGVYDVLVPFFGEVTFTVWAKDAAEAIALVDDYDYKFEGRWHMSEVDDVTVTDVKETGRTEDDDTASIEDVEYGRSWEPDYYEPEPPEREDYWE